MPCHVMSCHVKSYTENHIRIRILDFYRSWSSGILRVIFTRVTIKNHFSGLVKNVKNGVEC